MNDLSDYVVSLYAQLDRYNARRRQLAVGWLAWLIACLLLVLIGVPLGESFPVLAIGGLVLLVISGITMLVMQFRLTMGWNRLEREVEALKRDQVIDSFRGDPAPAKQKNSVYALSDDGELVEVADSEAGFDDDSDTLRQESG